MTRHGYLHEFMLYHRYESWTLDITELTNYKVSKGMISNAWQFIQNCMDTSRPLPKHPLLEAYRHLDPITGQPKRKWRDLDEAQRWARELGDSPNQLEQGGYVNYLSHCRWHPEKF